MESRHFFFLDANHISTTISPAMLITSVGLELSFKYRHKYSVNSKGSYSNWGGGGGGGHLLMFIYFCITIGQRDTC